MPRTRKPAARTKRSSRRARKARPRPSSDQRAVRRALDRMDAAHRAARATGEQLLAVADRIAADAQESVLARLARDLSDRQLLRDVAALASACDGIADLPPALKPFQLLSAGLQEWFRDALALTPDRSAGDELEVEAGRLAHFSVVGDAPTAGLVRLRVLHPGWKRRGRPIVPPAVVVIP